MKKLLVILLALLACFSLTGCGDASAEVSNNKDVLMKIGDASITRGDLYKQMLSNDQGSFISELALKAIVDVEIADAPEFEETAQKKIDEYIEKYETLEDVLSTLGYETLDELKGDLVYSEKFVKLINDYIENNYNDLYQTYSPRKARIMKFTKTDNGESYAETAQKALDEVKAGGDFETVAAKYVAADYASMYKETFYTTLSSLDKVIATYLQTIDSPKLSEQIITNTDVAYVIQVTVTNAEQLRTDLTTLLADSDDFAIEVYAKYLDKYNFTIYDITTYNIFKNNYPEYIVQDKKSK